MPEPVLDGELGHQPSIDERKAPHGLCGARREVARADRQQRQQVVALEIAVFIAAKGRSPLPD